MYSKIKKNTYISLGFICVVFAFIGVFLPVLPTTPFALLAAYFFSHSSEKFYRWLISLPALGPLIINWQKHRVIVMRAKINSTLLILCFFSWSLYRFQDKIWISLVIGLIMTGVLIFIWTRTSKITPKSE